ncbi:MAG: hypothetical protein GY751_06210, partial [Bacteroidetes bacterium]|nr:hypothetical protein [Bacteroidota bacterium]
SLATNRFFQYQAVFESLDSTEKALLKSVQVGPTHYNAGWPSVVNNTGITYDYLTSFAETTVGSGTIQYQISNDGSNWKYFNGVNWIAVGSDVNSNDASTINTNITSFASDIGTGTFYYKAFLISGGDGTLSLDLDDVQLGYATIQ